MKDSHVIRGETLEAVMDERFSRYAKSIIQQRAIPDDRDGLKPVQRRILFAMNKSGNTYKHPYRKSAKAVGDVMGNLHPHGDSSIYEALIYMSQNWKMREPLIDLHGNNGSMDGDPAAAMRYTEARTSRIAKYMLQDINKNTVSWTHNFDDTEYEPMVLPSRFPNLVVNGATGISAGYATNIPPHNLSEVINAVIYLQSHPDASLDELMHFIKGPDFPTGGIIQGLTQLKHAYKTGRGKIYVRARDKIEKIRGGRQQIRITEIPYGVNKKHLVKQIQSININHKINGIAEVLDETDRKGLTIIVSLRRNADAKGILNYLYKKTDLQIAYHFNVVAIDQMQPKRLSLKAILMAYLNFQRQIVYNRTKYDLGKRYDHQEIVKGLIKAMSILNPVIRTIRSSKNRTNASKRLIKKFHFTTRQADSIVALRLYRLTNTDVTALKQRNRMLNMQIHYYKEILNDPIKLDAVLRMELRHIQKEYPDKRRTTIEDKVQNLHISKKVTVPNEDVMVLVSHDGFLKRSSLRSYKASTGHKDGLRSGDYPLFIKELNTRNHLFMFTNKGNLIYRPVVKIRNAKWKDVGQHISQDIGLAHNEHIIKVFSSKSLNVSGKFLFETNDGYIKKTTFKNLKPGRNYRKHASTFMRLKHKDSTVVNVIYLPKGMPNNDILLISKDGFAVRFGLNEVPTVGSNASGVKSMNLSKDDSIKDLQLVDNNDLIGLITEQGTFSIEAVNDISQTNRNRKGVHVIYYSKNKKHHLIDFIKLSHDYNEIIHVHTKHHVIRDVTPAHFAINNLTQRGQQILNPIKLGRPVNMSYFA